MGKRTRGFLEGVPAFQIEDSGGAGDGGGWLDMGGEFLLVLGKGSEITFDLDAVPEFLGLAEEGPEADRHGGCDGTTGVNDLVDGTRCDANGTGHGVLRNTHRNQVLLQKDLSGRDGWIHRDNVLRYRGASMVITNRDLCGAMLVPRENDSPLVIDTDRVVAR